MHFHGEPHGARVFAEILLPVKCHGWWNALRYRCENPALPAPDKALWSYALERTAFFRGFADWLKGSRRELLEDWLARNGLLCDLDLFVPQLLVGFIRPEKLE